MKSFTLSSISHRAVTIKDIASRAKLSLAAVSYALRNDSKIPLGTRQHVQAVARELGYRPNPRIASLMAYIRRAHSRETGEKIAFVWVHTTRAEALRDPFLQKVLLGARTRAAQTGFELEEFWPNEGGMNDRRLQQILRTRGIVGVVLSPVTTNEATVAMNWDWSPFAAAVIGNVTWTPEMHHAGHHHFLGMRLALLELQRLGFRRPAALIDQETNERGKRAWEAAFLTHYPEPKRARAFLRILPPAEMLACTTSSWLSASGADALIVSTTRLLDTPKLRTVCHRLSLPIVSLHWNENSEGIGGIDQCYDQIAAHAVDLVVAQLNSNETGTPDLPRIMLFPGRWVPPRLSSPGIRGRSAKSKA